MWPKAFAQFVELAPHISRLLPLADRFLQSKTVTEPVSTAAPAELQEIFAAQGLLAKQITSLSESIAVAGSEAHATRTSIESMDTKLSLAASLAGNFDTRLTAVEDRLGVIDTNLQRVTERVRFGPVVLLLVLTNLMLLAVLVAVLVRGR